MGAKINETLSTFGVFCNLLYIPLHRKIGCSINPLGLIYRNFDLNKCLTNIPREIDGKKSLLDISEKLQLPFKLVEEVCFLLKEKKLVHLKWSSPFLK